MSAERGAEAVMHRYEVRLRPTALAIELNPVGAERMRQSLSSQPVSRHLFRWGATGSANRLARDGITGLTEPYVHRVGDLP